MVLDPDCLNPARRSLGGPSVLAIMLVVTAMPAETAETLLPPDAAEDEYNGDFGRSVDFDNDIMAVGAPGAAGVYLFQHVETGWQSIAKLDAPGSAQGTFGAQVSIDDGLLAVSQPEAEVNGLQRAGVVHVYERGDSSSEWRHVVSLTAPTPLHYGHFGSSLSASDNRVLVNGNPGYEPAAYLFERSAAGDWALARMFAGEDGSGLAVSDNAIEGNRIAFAGSGDGFIYEYGSTGWLLSDRIELGEAETVALEGDVLVLGAPGEDIGELPRVEGVAYVYERDDGDWIRTARLHDPQGGTAYGYFGLRLDIQDGLLVVGEGHESGAVHAFSKNTTGEWTDFFTNREGSMHGILHVPAISARTMAIGYSQVVPGHVSMYNVADLFAAAEVASEEEDAGGDDENGGDGNSDTGSDDQGAGGNDSSGIDGSNDDDSGDESDQDAGAGSGSQDSSTGSPGSSSSTSVSPAAEPEGSSGGGVFLWLALFGFLMPRGSTGRTWPTSGSSAP